ncbi:MAG TPA: peptide chain release factor N(5)-glutamine methyltransferase [Rikenellaceae bacterium]|nr:peptide chain release factor N(5)-glutamine methyltransferase [Rikenellaceae bacterium]HCQ72372.1 peptide chain release factor N(5)-glutamine methyltransferase [Rikenellaceae bacterium]
MLLKDFLNEGVTRLEPLYPTKEARSIVLMLCESRIGTKSYTHIVEPEYQIKDKALEGLNSDLDRLASGEPVQYVIGFADFCGLRFKVTPDVLIPRPETELLCREAIKIGSRMQRMRKAYGKSARPVRVLDLCTGSGCIAWTVALNIPGAEVTGVDISEKAIEVAKGQDFAIKQKEDEVTPPKFVTADILSEPQSFAEGEYDLILSNPPYIMESQKSQMRANVLNFEPSTALFVKDENPLEFYRSIAKISKECLASEGKGMTEINELLGLETSKVFSDAGFSKTEVVKDFYDKNRFVFYSK